MSLVLGLDAERGDCPVCGTVLCTCQGANEPYVGTPIGLADAVALGLLNEDGSAPVIRARGKAQKEPVEEKAASGGKRKVPRDKAMRGPREPANEE